MTANQGLVGTSAGNWLKTPQTNLDNTTNEDKTLK